MKETLHITIRPDWEPFRRRRLYGCAKRGCDKVNPPYLSFRGGDKGYCLDHIPLRYRIKVWWQERRHG